MGRPKPTTKKTRRSYVEIELTRARSVNQSTASIDDYYIRDALSNPINYNVEIICFDPSVQGYQCMNGMLNNKFARFAELCEIVCSVAHNQ